MTGLCHNKTVKYLCSYNQSLTKNVSLTRLSLIFLGGPNQLGARSTWAGTNLTETT